MYNFYYCGQCKSVFASVGDTAEHCAPSCCEKGMTKLIPNNASGLQNQDGQNYAGGQQTSVEHHVPLMSFDGQSVTVYVGAQDHPMTPRHHIRWIAVAQGDQLLIKTLERMSAPSARFNVNPLDGKVTAYAFCVQHGLWASRDDG